jgi:hypothetical protein
LISVVLAAQIAFAKSGTEQTAILTVSSSALVFSGDGLQPPDSEGHFAIGIKLPQASIKATHCETPYLIVGMGTLNRPEDSLTQAEKNAIERNNTRYRMLLAVSKKEEIIRIPVRNNSTYLKFVNNQIIVPFCMLSIDEGSDP